MIGLFVVVVLLGVRVVVIMVLMVLIVFWSVGMVRVGVVCIGVGEIGERLVVVWSLGFGFGMKLE